jgi:alpha-D-ribose 1-methylphosphonate 5-phosphate C-P lyase
MAEYAYNPVQLVEPNQNILLDTVIPCNKGYVYHRNQSGIVILRGIVNCHTSCFARYQVAFNGNIALPDGATVGAISVALAIDGEPIQTSKAIVTPADTATNPPTAENFFNVTSTAIITVPKGCCFSVTIENTSAPATPGGVAPEILVQNANLTVSRIA